MRTVPRFAAAFAFLLLVVPATIAGPNPGIPDVPAIPVPDPDGTRRGCRIDADNAYLESGEVTVKGYGKRSAHGSWVDGCGGNGCDDSMDGAYLYGDVYYYFEVHEVRTSSGCSYSCSAQLPSGTTARRYETYGRLEIDEHEQAIWFSCGDLLTSGFIYHHWNWGGTTVHVAHSL